MDSAQITTVEQSVDIDHIQEHRDTPDQLARKAHTLAQLIRNSYHTIFFTGAGISTSANIPDYRGPDGLWTCKAQGRDAPTPKLEGTFASAQPTLTHRAIAALVRSTLAKFVVSQNIDGLHLRSGLERSQLCEMHGNSFLHVCWECGSEFLQDTEVLGHEEERECAQCNHKTAFCHCIADSSCPKCGNTLKDSIVNFREQLPQHEIKRAFENAAVADLCIVAGSSCRVAPAAQVPYIVGKRSSATLVIINLQATPLDDFCKLRIWGDLEEVFDLVMEFLVQAEPDRAWPTEFAAYRDRPERSISVEDVPQENSGRTTGQPFAIVQTMQGAEWTLTLRAIDPHAVERVLFQLPQMCDPAGLDADEGGGWKLVGAGCWGEEVLFFVTVGGDTSTIAHTLTEPEL
eukprot:TRINITY_DN63611_c0_g2_i1.p1 TRINITY_DN63611_c0_g2~~TRINITY_DN63611_c0_g2_i1.p1  ORF type:complete len:402 (+),score=37.44 TRINITY_DN63611_c0_g2_i1:55-1260(+)